MAFCPECIIEYGNDVSECPRCGEDLVEKLPESYDKDWVKFDKMPGTIYAEMVKGALEDQGIPCMLRRDFLSTAYGTFGTDPINNSILLVPRARYAEAEDIVNSMFSGDEGS